MIKVIAFDLVGVLVGEKDIDLTDLEDKLERKFGDIISDDEYIIDAKSIINDKDIIINSAKEVINKLYYVKDFTLFKNIKEKYPDIKIIITTNHVSYVRNFIINNLDNNNLDDIIISAEIGKAKPDNEFFQYVLDKYSINPEELLFLDDSQRHIDGASVLGINTIKVNKDTDMYNEIINRLQ